MSIVIPLGPGEDAHLGLLQCLEEFPGTCEVIVSACEPQRSAAPKPPAIGIQLRRVTGSAGRAAQFNRGVAASSGHCLWLLHADTRPAPSAMARAAAFAEACRNSSAPSTVGWFSLAFAADGPRIAAINAAGANLRSRLLHLPFGDQAWLMRREFFETLGGFDEDFGRGEDLDFIRRARRAGARLCRQNAVVTTSARRFREHGWFATTLAHLWLTLRLWLKSDLRSRGTQN